MTAEDLTEIDLAYAPPYAFLLNDPVNMAGYVIENILESTVKQIHWNEALEIASTNTKAVILDTRTQAEFNRGHIEGNPQPHTAHSRTVAAFVHVSQKSHPINSY